MDVKTYVQENLLLFDGAMGTYYAAQHPKDAMKCEWANINHPQRIATIHKEYLEAGAGAIKTNTFGANTQALECTLNELYQIINTGWRLACEAAQPYNAAVFACIGPLPEDNAEYYLIIDQFLELGATCFLFETFSDDTQIHALADYIKGKCPEAFLLASFAVTPDGFTRQGLTARALMAQAQKNTNIDAAGFNCISGPHHLLMLTREIAQSFSRSKTLLSIMPNAGYPAVVDGRTVFDSSPAYFAERCAEIAALGARILGGCCGTTPEHIRQTAKVIRKRPAHRVDAVVGRQIEPSEKPMQNNRLAAKFNAGKRIVAVELDPPADANIEKFMEGARRLKAVGVDAVTIADCPVARVRVDSSMLAAKLRRELDIDPIPHMTCRDRNINATKALLLGLSAEQVSNVLVVTGDPIPSAARDEVKGVFSFNSVMLADYIRQLSNEGLSTPFRVYGALNVNARNFDAELKKAVRKQDAGITTFLTQPVFTEAAFENLALAYKELDATILGGVIPIVSHRNALFMSQEMAGIDIPEQIISRYEGLDRAQAEALAAELSIALAKRMTAITDGWYLITPFQRVQLIEQILEGLTED